MAPNEYHGLNSVPRQDLEDIHTPTNENITLNVGNAFDIVGQTSIVGESNPSYYINMKTCNCHSKTEAISLQ